MTQDQATQATRGTTLDRVTQQSIIEWAVQRSTPITVSLWRVSGTDAAGVADHPTLDEDAVGGAPSEMMICNLRSHLIRYDRGHQMLQIAYPIRGGDGVPPEIVVGDQLGVSFRRGHKKCIFVSAVVARQREPAAADQPCDTLLIRAPEQMKELQRRAYQRVSVPPEYFVAAKIWQGGGAVPAQPSWPLCAGRVGNISVGGVFVDIRAEQDPQLSVGDIVAVEITAAQGHQSLVVEGQYRHCAVTGPGRVGLGLQFIGLEHQLPGRASVTQIAELVRKIQRECSRRWRSRS